MSVSFDRAAGYYDRTRAQPDDVMARLLEALAAILPRDPPCLEIGVGTGRIAIPLYETGVKVVGADISLEMLRKLAAKRVGDGPEMTMADATHLPFADATFGSAIASHVLHLIPDWRDAVRELVRVIRPGGILAASRGSHLKGGWRDEVSARFFREAGDPPWPPGMDDIAELDAEMAAIGAEREPFPDLLKEEAMSIDELLQTMTDGVWAACWALDHPTRKRAAAATRDWAIHEYGDLSVARPLVAGSVWRAYRLP